MVLMNCDNGTKEKTSASAAEKKLLACQRLQESRRALCTQLTIVYRQTFTSVLGRESNLVAPGSDFTNSEGNKKMLNASKLRLASLRDMVSWFRKKGNICLN